MFNLLNPKRVYVGNLWEVPAVKYKVENFTITTVIIGTNVFYSFTKEMVKY